MNTGKRVARVSFVKKVGNGGDLRANKHAGSDRDHVCDLVKAVDGASQ